MKQDGGVFLCKQGCGGVVTLDTGNREIAPGVTATILRAVLTSWWCYSCSPRKLSANIPGYPSLSLRVLQQPVHRLPVDFPLLRLFGLAM